MSKKLLISLTLGLWLTLVFLGLLEGSDLKAFVENEGQGNKISVSQNSCQARVFDGLSDGPIFSTVQEAVDASTSATDIIKVVGYCAGVQSRAGVIQTVYLSKSLTIRGGYTTTNWSASDPAANPTTLDATGLGRVFYVTGSSLNATIENLRLTGGQVSDYGGGAGIYISQATVTLSNCQVFGNNTSSWSGGGMRVSSGSITMNGGQIFSNTAGTGGGVSASSGSFTMNGGQIFSNTASFGGGIDVSGDTTVNGGQIFGNTGTFGGGVRVSSGEDFTMNGGQIFGNTGTFGGGVTVYGNTTVNGGQIFGNIAGSGGGVRVSSGSITMNGGQIFSNTASSEGGGMFVVGGTTALTNTTISGNEARDGGGIHNDGGTVVLTNTTISSNTTTSGGLGGGIYHIGGTTSLKNTIVANSLSGGDCTGAITSNGHNLSGDASCYTLIAAGDIIDTDPLLGPLQDNGGDTLTHALMPGSPAINAGDNHACPTIDQRGVVRPQGSVCDIGAYEASADAIYIPIILKPDLTTLYIKTINTGGATVYILNMSDTQLLSCTVADNTTQLCGMFPSIGSYKIKAQTARCGWLGPETFHDATGGTITRTVFCD